MDDEKASLQQTENESLIPEESEEHREVSIQGFVAAMSRRDPAAVIADKIQPEQIDKYLDFAARDKELGWQDREQGRKHERSMTGLYLLFTFLFVAFLLVVLLSFKEIVSANMLENILCGLGGAVLGGFGGYGLGRWKKSE